MYLRHDVEPKNWPADLSDRDSVTTVFRAYGSSHIAASRHRSRPDKVTGDSWVTCSCGLSTAPVLTDYSNDRAVWEAAAAFVDQHIEDTRG
ncbi:hypothetical protein [Kitasatospora sp. NPDC127116]|uniref:hypothetical protein n=1 Tax=Kitasatospora sp. NPDC127116 TaxID=3345367 RepID=UPI00363A765B